MLEVTRFVFNPFQENTYLLHDETLACVVVDPGCYEKEEEQELVQYIDAQQLNVVMILNTHCHIDHVLGNAFAKDHFKVPLYIPKLEEDRKSTRLNSSHVKISYAVFCLKKKES